MHAAVLLLSSICLQADTGPLNVLYVTGGGYHDYTKQEIILREGLSKRANITWTTWKGKKTKAGVPELYLKPGWAKTTTSLFTTVVWETSAMEPKKPPLRSSQNIELRAWVSWLSIARCIPTAKIPRANGRN